MVSTHPSGSFLSSLAKNRIGRIPFASNSQNCRSSRAILVRILFCQYSGNFSSRPSFSFPCQKSPSTKTAIFCRGKNTSGVPGTPLRCFLYRNSGQKRFMSEKSCFSGPVFFDLIRRMTSDRFSGVNMSVMVRYRSFEMKTPSESRRGPLEIRWCSRQESNLHPSLRRAIFYPLKYGSAWGILRNTRRKSSLFPFGRKFGCDVSVS